MALFLRSRCLGSPWAARLTPRIAALAASVLLAACGTVTTTPGGVPIDTQYNAKGQDSRVMFLVLHYTVGNFQSSLKTLTQDQVSAHYLVTDETPPRILRLVPEERRAWHSGRSAWGENARLNASSIGIEIVHPGFRIGADGRREYLPFPPAQIDALIPLVRDIVTRHQILPSRVLGHGEVSPSYKEDPGPTFPWARLAAEGITPPLPDATRVAAKRAEFLLQPLPEPIWFQSLLAEHGYAVDKSGRMDGPTMRVLMNFQMRYRPALFDGRPDAETAALLWVLRNPLPPTPTPTPMPAPGQPAAPAPAPVVPVPVPLR